MKLSLVSIALIVLNLSFASSGPKCGIVKKVETYSFNGEEYGKVTFQKGGKVTIPFSNSEYSSPYVAIATLNFAAQSIDRGLELCIDPEAPSAVGLQKDPLKKK